MADPGNPEAIAPEEEFFGLVNRLAVPTPDRRVAGGWYRTEDDQVLLVARRGNPIPLVFWTRTYEAPQVIDDNHIEAQCTELAWLSWSGFSVSIRAVSQLPEFFLRDHADRLGTDLTERMINEGNAMRSLATSTETTLSEWILFEEADQVLEDAGLRSESAEFERALGLNIPDHEERERFFSVLRGIDPTQRIETTDWFG